MSGSTSFLTIWVPFESGNPSIPLTGNLLSGRVFLRDRRTHDHHDLESLA